MLTHSLFTCTAAGAHACVSASGRVCDQRGVRRVWCERSSQCEEPLQLDSSDVRSLVSVRENRRRVLCLCLCVYVSRCVARQLVLLCCACANHGFAVWACATLQMPVCETVLSRTYAEKQGWLSLCLIIAHDYSQSDSISRPLRTGDPRYECIACNCATHVCTRMSCVFVVSCCVFRFDACCAHRTSRDGNLVPCPAACGDLNSQRIRVISLMHTRRPLSCPLRP